MCLEGFPRLESGELLGKRLLRSTAPSRFLFFVFEDTRAAVSVTFSSSERPSLIKRALPDRPNDSRGYISQFVPTPVELLQLSTVRRVRLAGWAAQGFEDS